MRSQRTCAHSAGSDTSTQTLPGSSAILDAAEKLPRWFAGYSTKLPDKM
jgi:hypothetical protein